MARRVSTMVPFDTGTIVYNYNFIFGKKQRKDSNKLAVFCKLQKNNVFLTVSVN